MKQSVGIASISAVIVVVILVSYSVRLLNESSDRATESLYEEIRAMGGIVTVDDIPDPRGRPAKADENDPDGDIAARLILRASTDYPELIFTEDDDTPLNRIFNEIAPVLDGVRGLTRTEADAIAAVVSDHSYALDLVTRSANYPPGTTDGILAARGYPMRKPEYDILIPHYPVARNIARLVVLQALLDSHFGNYDKAVARLRDGISSAHHVLDMQDAITVRLGFKLLEIYLDGLRSVLRTGNPETEPLIESIPFFLQANRAAAVNVACMMDFFVLTETWQQMFGDPDSLLEGIYYSDKIRFIRKREYEIMLRKWSEVIPILNSDRPEMLQQLRQWSDDFNGSVVPLRSWSMAAQNAMVTGAYELPIYLHMNYQTDSRVAAVACAAIAYYNDAGEYPATLEELIPKYLLEAPLDPYTANPLIYRPEGTGFVVYGVGRDQIDGGGLETGRQFDGDIVWDLSNRKSLEELRQTQ